MKRRFLVAATALLMSAGVYAQDVIKLDSPVLDVFNFSYLGLNGTASYVARGGAIGALGGDFTAASYNPAGLGFFYSSRMSFTPTIDYAQTHSSYMGFKTNASRTTFKVGSFELLLALPATGSDESSWRSFQFGIGMTRLKSFNGRNYVIGDATRNSLLDVWCDEANYYGSLESFTSLPAFNTYLMDSVAGNEYYNNFSGSGDFVVQEQNVTTKGGISEIPISFSGNYGDKLYVGATIGIPILSYSSTTTYRETAQSTGDYFIFNQNYDVSATGINFKFGAIFRPVEMLRIGFAIHTPTYYEVKDIYSTSIYNSENNKSSYSVESEGIYNFHTPMKLLASVAATFGNQASTMAGSIDVDYEFSNYSNMRFSPLDNDLNDLDYEKRRNNYNYQIENAYRSGHTVRVGGSLNIRHWVLRAGLVYNSNPYKEFDTEFINAETLTLACGFGYQTSHMFWDFAFAHSTGKNIDAFNTLKPETIYYNNYGNLFTSTIGFKF